MASVNRPTLAGLQAQVEALRHNLNLVETERDSLRMKVDDLKLQACACAAHCDELVAERDALLVQLRPSREVAKPVVAQISERRAAMQRAREEAMATGRYVKV